jgi:hypothetical protein
MNNEPNSGTPPPIPPIPSMPPVPDVPDVPETPAGSGVQETAEKAFGMAKAGVLEGVSTYKALDRPAQVYLGGLAVAFLCGIVFDVVTIQFKSSGMPGLENLMGQAPSIPAFQAGAKGKLAVLAAAAGIGIWIWNFKAAKKESWVPQALAGCAVFSALMFFLLLFTGGFKGPFGEVDVDMTLLGFWVPWAGTIAASVFSVMKLKR